MRVHPQHQQLAARVFDWSLAAVSVLSGARMYVDDRKRTEQKRPGGCALPLLLCQVHCAHHDACVKPHRLRAGRRSRTLYNGAGQRKRPNERQKNREGESKNRGSGRTCGRRETQSHIAHASIAHCCGFIRSCTHIISTRPVTE